jgi:hypothetical protein
VAAIEDTTTFNEHTRSTSRTNTLHAKVGGLVSRWHPCGGRPLPSHRGEVEPGQATSARRPLFREYHPRVELDSSLP